MTENYWQQEKKRIEMNKGNIHPVLQQTYDDKRALVPNKNFRELYYNCLQGALYLNQYAQSENISLDDMGMLICRDVGCELQYCQASMSDPFEKPFENCDQHYKLFSDCMSQEKRRYLHDGQGRTMQEQIAFMLEKKRKEKYQYITQFEQPHNVKPEEQLNKEYILKNSNNDMLKEIELNQKL